MVILRSLVTTGAIFLYGLQEAHGQVVADDGGITCPEIFQTPGLCLLDNNIDQGEGGLSCNAGDIEKKTPNEAKLEVQQITTGCTGPSSTATFQADLTYTVGGGATRYDIGLYVASDAEADGYEGSCSIFSFGCSALDANGTVIDDLCGDRQGFNREQGLDITAACVANDEGQFTVPYCFSYSQNIDSITCTDDNGLFVGDPQPFQALPGSTSKCQCDVFDLGNQICLVNLNMDANALQPTCTVDGLTDIEINGDDIVIVGAGENPLVYEISPGDGPQVYSAGENIVIESPSSETTYTIVVRRENDLDVACEDTFEITTGECGPDTCDDTADFAGCGIGFSLIEPAVECVGEDGPTTCTEAICCVQDTCDDTADFAGCGIGFSLIEPAVECVGEDGPTTCTEAICCVQDTCASYDGLCVAGTSPVDDTVPCDGACAADTCCDQDTCDDTADFAGCGIGFSLIEPAVECVGEDGPTTCTEAICCVQDTCASYDGLCVAGTSPVDDTVPCDGACAADTCCDQDTCDDTADFAGCGIGFSLIEPAVECVGEDGPTTCTEAICCVQDTCASYDGVCVAGTSPVDDTVPCDGACAADTCCDQDTCDDTADFAGCGIGFSLIEPAVECVGEDGPTTCTEAICCDPDTCADDFDVSNCELGTVPVADLTIECGEDCALTCCEPCDTAYGCESVIGEGADASCASPALNGIDGIAASRWGWYTKPDFGGTEQVLTFDMYAGAGGNDLTAGEYAGSIVVTVNSDGSPGETVVFPEGDYCFDDIHVHVGTLLPTTKKGKTTSVSVAPGQYTQTAVEPGPFYVIVHVGFACSPCGIPA